MELEGILADTFFVEKGEARPLHKLVHAANYFIIKMFLKIITN
jgi:hypothetical protein